MFENFQIMIKITFLEWLYFEKGENIFWKCLPFV